MPSVQGRGLEIKDEAGWSRVSRRAREEPPRPLLLRVGARRAGDVASDRNETSKHSLESQEQGEKLHLLLPRKVGDCSQHIKNILQLQLYLGGTGGGRRGATFY